MSQTSYELGRRLRVLYECLLVVHTTVTKDIPEPHKVAERLDEVLQDLSDRVIESITAVSDLPTLSDTNQARNTLVYCHQQCQQLSQGFWTEVAAYEPMFDLMQVGRELGGEWRNWSQTVKNGLDACKRPLFDVLVVLPICWQEISSRGTAVPLTVHNSSFVIHSSSGGFTKI